MAAMGLMSFFVVCIARGKLAAVCGRRLLRCGDFGCSVSGKGEKICQKQNFKVLYLLRSWHSCASRRHFACRCFSWARWCGKSSGQFLLPSHWHEKRRLLHCNYISGKVLGRSVTQSPYAKTKNMAESVRTDTYRHCLYDTHSSLPS